MLFPSAQALRLPLAIFFSSQPGAAQKRVKWSLLSLIVSVGLFALLVVLLFSSPLRLHIGQAVQGISQRPELLAVFLATYAGAFYLRTLAWGTLLGKVSPSSSRLFSILHVALLGNHLFPAKVGEPLRIGLAAGHGVPLGQAVGTTLVARLLDLAALGSIALTGVALATGWGDSAMKLVLLLSVMLCGGVVTYASLLSEQLQQLWARLPRPLGAAITTLRDALQETSPSRVARAFALVLLSWLLEGGVLWVVAQAAGVPLSAPVAVAATAFTIAFQTIQFTPGGLGLYEATQTGALALYGIDPTVGLALAVSTHALKFAYSFVLGFPFCALESLSLSEPFPRSVTNELRSAAGAPVTAVGRWVDVSLFVAAFSVALVSSSISAVLPGLLLALPLAVLARCHYLPVRLLPVLLLVPMGFWVIFGFPSIEVALLALVLGLPLVFRQWRLQGGWAAPYLFWPALLSQAMLAGGEQPIGVLVFGVSALAAVVLVRQWWLSYHPLPASEPLSVGSTIVVVIPVHNEEPTIADVIGKVPREKLVTAGYAVRVIVVDDGSSDGSAQAALSAGADQIVQHPECRGIGAAMRSGFVAAQGARASAVAYIDGDGEYDPRDLVPVLSPVLRGEADVVLGNRFPGASRVMCRSRLWGNRVFTLLVQLLAGRNVRDAQTGCRAFSARAVAQAEILRDYNYAQVLTLDLLRKGMRLEQVPIKYCTRTTGTSFIRYRQYLSKVLPAIAAEVLGP